MGFFGDLFDLNNDGQLDVFEQSMDLYAFTQVAENEEKMTVHIKQLRNLLVNVIILI
ncbi:MAG: hypothetical protein IKU25_02145 [Clostridia bacterium]|nr:hypothetical protein [Clostridia bacterium]